MTGPDEKETRPQPAAAPYSPALTALAAMLLAAAAVVMINYLAARHYKRADWTAGSYYTLSQKTVNILKGLTRPVEITVFISASSPLYPDIREIVSRYRSVTPKIKTEFVDPDIDEARFQLLQKKHNIRSGTLSDGTQISEQVIVVSAGDQVKFVTPEDMTEFEFDEDPYASEPSLKSFKAEEALTATIMSLTEKATTTICFSTGHGEWAVDRYDERGIGHVEELLKRDNYTVESVQLSEKKIVPQACKLLVIAGPERPFNEPDALKVETYFKGGGNLLVFLDPIVDGTRFVPTGLEKVLQTAGVDVRSAIIVESDESKLLPVSGVGMETFISRDYGEHPITAPLEGVDTIFRIAMPLSASGTGGVTPAPIVRSSASSWGETNLESVATGEAPEKGDDDIQGPITLGFAATLPSFAAGGSEQENDQGGKSKKKESRGRIVVFGDSDMLYADFFGQLTLVNQEIVLGSVAWLTERPALISIAPKNPENVKLTLTDAQMKTVFFWLVINLPLLAIIAGVLIWWRRRK